MDQQRKPTQRSTAPSPRLEDSQPVRNGGTEDLMVDGRGGTLPLKGFAEPDYYSRRKRKP